MKQLWKRAWLLVALAMPGLGVAGKRYRAHLRAQSRAEVQAEAAAERTRFLRHLDHEMKNPLMAIRAALANLEGTDDIPTRTQIRNTIEAQTLYLSKLVSDLRKLANIETLPVESEPVDIHRLLSEVLILAREDPDAITRHFTLDLPDEPLLTTGDADLLLHAWYSLVQNALKFTRPGDHIGLSATTQGAWILVQISDTGIGIDPEDLPHVCEELYRGRNARELPGSGIGLALVRAIVGRHNGFLDIDSTPDEGTIVRVYLVAGITAPV